VHWTEKFDTSVLRHFSISQHQIFWGQWEGRCQCLTTNLQPFLLLLLLWDENEGVTVELPNWTEFFFW